MSDNVSLAPLKVGMLGLSIDAINVGEWGYVYLPLGKRDATVAGGREWIRIRVQALETIRAERDIIIANAMGEVKEHTPVELSYQKLEGGYQRVTEAYPLPTTMGTKALNWVNINKTDTSTTALVTPSSTKKVRVHFVIVSNNQGAVVNVGLTFSSSPSVAADYKIRLYVPADGGTVPLNLTDANIEGAVGQVLYAYCAAAYANGVYFNIAYTEE